MVINYRVFSNGKTVAGVNIACYVKNTGKTFWAETNGVGEGLTNVVDVPFPANIEIFQVHPGYTMPKKYMDGVPNKDMEVTLELVPFGKSGVVMLPPTALHVYRNKSVAVLYNKEDKRVYYKGTTDYSLYKMFLDGVDIAPILKDRNKSNVVRVLGEFSGPGFKLQLVRKNEPHFYERTKPFADYLAQYNKYCEFVVFADEAQQYDHSFNHLEATIESFDKAGNILFEVCNEPNQNFAHDEHVALEWGRKVMGRGHLIASGVGEGTYNGDSEYYFKNCCDYSTMHRRRDGQYEVAPKYYRDDLDYVATVNSDACIVDDEPIGFGTNVPGSRDDSIEHAFILGVQDASRHAGGTFHSQQGVDSFIFTGRTRECYDAFMDGMIAVEACGRL